MRLDQLDFGVRGVIAAIDWPLLGEKAGQRLRAMGFDQGVEVELLHGAGLFARDPIACRVGRMTVAIRRAHAAAMTIEARP